MNPKGEPTPSSKWETNIQAAELKAKGVIAQLSRAQLGRATTPFPVLHGCHQVIETSPEVVRVTSEFWKARPSWVTGNTLDDVRGNERNFQIFGMNGIIGGENPGTKKGEALVELPLLQFR